MTEKELWREPCTPAELMERLARKDVRRELANMVSSSKDLSEDQLEDVASDVVLKIVGALAAFPEGSRSFRGGAPLTLAVISRRVALDLKREHTKKRLGRFHLKIRAKELSANQMKCRGRWESTWTMPGKKPDMLDVLRGEGRRDGALATKSGKVKRTVRPTKLFLSVTMRDKSGKIVEAPEGFGWDRKGRLCDGSGYYAVNSRREGAEYLSHSLQEAKIKFHGLAKTTPKLAI